jgi:hypothetical protein
MLYLPQPINKQIISDAGWKSELAVSNGPNSDVGQLEGMSVLPSTADVVSPPSMSGSCRYCCKSLFASPIANSLAVRSTIE